MPLHRNLPDSGTPSHALEASCYASYQASSSIRLTKIMNKHAPHSFSYSELGSARNLNIRGYGIPRPLADDPQRRVCTIPKPTPQCAGNPEQIPTGTPRRVLVRHT